MKKLFKFALVAFAAAAVVACQKPASSTDESGKDTPGGGEDTPGTEEVVPVEGTADWAIIGTLLGTNWDKDYKSAQDGDVYVVKNVKLAAATEFKWRDTTSGNGGWDVNRGGTFAAVGEAFDVEQNGANIKPGLDGVYDIYLNLAVNQAAVVAKNGAAPTWKEPAPAGQSWDYVMDIHDYRINSTFMFDEVTKAIKLNPSAVAFQWKFYSNKWNNHKFQDKDENNYQLYCNRLGEFADAIEKNTVLLRFSNDGNADGQLCLNCDFLGTGQQQVAKDGAAFVWPTEEWCVLTLTTDGTNISLYCNSDLVATYEQKNQKEEWKFGRFDISMTWKEGSTANDWPLRQAFNGSIAYTRVWDKSLSAEDVAASLCDVPVDSEGLVVYWVYNLDEGSVIENKVAANAEYKLDFSKAWDGNGSKNNTSEYAEASWTAPAKPVCAE